MVHTTDFPLINGHLPVPAMSPEAATRHAQQQCEACSRCKHNCANPLPDCAGPVGWRELLDTLAGLLLLRP
jgi:hypothetical protein